MGSKLARRNRALKRMQQRDNVPVGEATVEECEYRGPGIYRIVSKEGHYGVVHASSRSAAIYRWSTVFYPGVSVVGATITQIQSW